MNGINLVDRDKIILKDVSDFEENFIPVMSFTEFGGILENYVCSNPDLKVYFYDENKVFIEEMTIEEFLKSDPPMVNYIRLSVSTPNTFPKDEEAKPYTRTKKKGSARPMRYHS